MKKHVYGQGLSEGILSQNSVKLRTNADKISKYTRIAKGCGREWLFIVIALLLIFLSGTLTSCKSEESLNAERQKQLDKLTRQKNEEWMRHQQSHQMRTVGQTVTSAYRGAGGGARVRGVIEQESGDRCKVSITWVAGGSTYDFSQYGYGVVYQGNTVWTPKRAWTLGY